MQSVRASDRAQRYKLFKPIELSCAGQAIRAHLLDLSSTGALAHAETPPPVGARVRVSAGFPLGTAKVIWANGKRFGIAFNLRLDAAQIDRAIAVG